MAIKITIHDEEDLETIAIMLDYMYELIWRKAE